MRLARTGDHWRRVYSRNYSTNITQFRFNNIAGLGEGAVDFNGGITAICGANGVGKSTLLNAIFSLLNPSPDILDNYPRLIGSNLDAEITTSKGIIKQSFQISEGSDEIEVSFTDLEIDTIMIDPPANCYEQIKFFRNMTNLDELLEGYESINSTKPELEQISYVVGKEYTSCKIYEIDEISGYGVVPYFEVQTSNSEYGTETMGLGELSAHQIIWQLKRCSNNSIIIIEEPESYLAPKSQEALVNVIAKYAQEKGIWVILSTHSPDILRRIPIDHIRLLARVDDNVQIITPNSRDAHLTSFGVPLIKSSVILVEDRFAREFLKTLLSHFDPYTIQKVEILDAGDESKLKSLLRTFPESGWLKIVGVFDGDLRSYSEKSRWPYTFLPGDVPPELLLKQAISKKIPMVSSFLAKDENLITIILSSLEGQDHHDWFIELQSKLGVSYDQLIFALFRVWITSDGNERAALEVFNEVIKLINVD